MKKLLILFLVLVISTVLSFAGERKASVSVNPFSLMLGITGIEGNFAVSDNISISLSYSNYSAAVTELLLDKDDPWDFSIYQITAGIRNYWQGSAPRGWYLSGLITYNSVSIKYDDGFYSGGAKANAMGYGFLIGHQYVWDGGMTLDTGLGMSRYTLPASEYRTSNPEGDKRYEELAETKMILPIIKVAIGYAF